MKITSDAQALGVISPKSRVAAILLLEGIYESGWREIVGLKPAGSVSEQSERAQDHNAYSHKARD
jgi:hypothetical protein